MENLSSLRDVLVDEVSLSGLEGVSLQVLWRRLEARTTFQVAVTEAVCLFGWKHLVERCKEIQFYERKTPFEDTFVVGNLNPLKTVKEYYGYTPKDPYASINDKSLGVRGLCGAYKTRRNVTDSVRCSTTGGLLCTYDQAVERYGDKLVLVASQKVRERSLWGKSDALAPVNDRQYCILEVIGRARTQGVTQRAIHAYLKLDPRSCFYDVRMLAKYKFITMQPFVNSPNERPGRVKTPMLLLPRFDHRVYSALDVAGELMSRYLEAQCDGEIKYSDHQWPSQIHPFLAQSCYYQLLLDGYWKVETPCNKLSYRRKAKPTTKSGKLDKESLQQKIGTRDGTSLSTRSASGRGEGANAEASGGEGGDGDDDEDANDSEMLIRSASSSVPATPTTVKRSIRAKRGSRASCSGDTGDDDGPVDTPGSAADCVFVDNGKAGSDGADTPAKDSKLLEQQRRLLRKPYNRPTAGSVISALKPFRAANSPWVFGTEKIADGGEDDDDAIVPTNAGEASIELPLGQHIYWFVEHTGSDGALLSEVCDSLVYKHDRHIKKKVQKKTTERHWGWIDAMLKDMGRVRKHVLVAKVHKAGNADMLLIDSMCKKGSGSSAKQSSVLPREFSPSPGKVKGSSSSEPPSSPSMVPATSHSALSPLPVPVSVSGRKKAAKATKAEVALATSMADTPLDQSLVDSYVSMDSQTEMTPQPASTPDVSPFQGHKTSLSQTPISVELQDMTLKPSSSVSKRMVTALQLKRQQMLLDFINKEEVVLTNQAVLFGLRNDHAVKDGEQQVSCRKTVVRAMQVLAQKGLVQCVKTSAEASGGNQTSVIAWVCNKMDVKSEEVPRRLRLLLPMTREDPTIELHGEREHKKKRSHKKKTPSEKSVDLSFADVDDGAAYDSCDRLGDDLVGDEDDAAPPSPQSAELLLYSKHQKMQRLRIFHIYLYRLMFGQPSDLKCGAASEVSSIVNQFPWLAEVYVVSDSTSPPGTMTCYDALVNMPFTVYFTLVGNIEQSRKCVPYLQKPEYMHKPLKHLPKFLYEDALCFNKRHTEAFRSVTFLLQLLEIMKLVKLQDENKMLKARKFSLLSSPSLIDTTLVSGGGYMLLDPELTTSLPAHQYPLTDIFSTIRFWYAVEDICRRTPLGSLHMKDNDDLLKERLKSQGVDTVHHFYSRDNHFFPRTCIGAAGYPPDFFAHRFWLLNWERKDRRVPQIRVEPMDPELFGSLTADDLEGLDPAVLKEILKDDTAQPAPASKRVKSMTGKAAAPSQGGRGLKRTRKSTVGESPSAKKPRKSTKENDVTGADSMAVPAGTPAFQRASLTPQGPQKMSASTFVKLSLSDFKLNMDVASTGLPTKKGISAEPEDIEAVSRMVKLRIAYSPAEDQYVLCHHVASCYLRCLGLEESTWSQCRDGIHKTIEESRDKSSGSLFRRARYLFKRQTVVRDCRVALLQVLQTLRTAVQRGGKLPDTYEQVFPIILQQDKNRPQGAAKLTDTVSELYEQYNVLNIDNEPHATHKWDEETEEDVQLSVVADIIQATTKAAMVEQKFDSLDAFSTLESFNSKLLEAVFQRFQSAHLLKRMRYREKSEYKRVHGHFPHSFNGFILTPGYFDLFEDRSHLTNNFANGRQLHQLVKTHGHVSLNVTIHESMFNACGVSAERSAVRNMAPARKKRLAFGSTTSVTGRKGTDAEISDGESDAPADDEIEGLPAKRLFTSPTRSNGTGLVSGTDTVTFSQPDSMPYIAGAVVQQASNSANYDAAVAMSTTTSATQPAGGECGEQRMLEVTREDNMDTATPRDGAQQQSGRVVQPARQQQPDSKSATQALCTTTEGGKKDNVVTATLGSQLHATADGAHKMPPLSSSANTAEALDVESEGDGNDSDSDIEDGLPVDFDAIADGTKQTGGKLADTSRPMLDELDLRMGAFHCFGSLLAANQIAVDGYLPSESINQKASAVGTLGAENVWRGLAYNVLEAVQANTGTSASPSANSSRTPVATSAQATSSSSTRLASTANDKKSVSFAFDSDAESSGDEGVGLVRGIAAARGAASGATATAAAAAAAAGGEAEQADQAEQADVSVGLTRVLGLSDNNVALKPCLIDLYSSQRKHICALDVDSADDASDAASKSMSLSCWQLRQSRDDIDCQHVRLLTSEPVVDAVSLCDLYQLFVSEDVPDKHDVDGVLSEPDFDHYRQSSVPSANLSAMSITDYRALCKQHLLWTDADLESCEVLYEQINQRGWRGLLVNDIKNIPLSAAGQCSVADHLQQLINFEMVILAGVNEKVAVATSNAKCWLVQSSVTLKIPVANTATKTEDSSSLESPAPLPVVSEDAEKLSSPLPQPEPLPQSKPVPDEEQEDAMDATEATLPSSAPITGSESAAAEATTGPESGATPTLLQKFGRIAPARRRPVHADVLVAEETTSHVSMPRQLLFPSRPWLNLEGATMENSAEQMLYGVARLIMSQPGIRKSRLLETFADVLRPTVVEQLLDNLCYSGLVEARVVEVCSKPSLFSKPTAYMPAARFPDNGSAGHHTYYIPTPDCMAQVCELL